MDSKQKMGVAGAAMIAAGVGLSVAGVALVTPFIVSCAIAAVHKGTEQAIAGVERASKTVGSAVGLVQGAVKKVSRGNRAA